MLVVDVTTKYSLGDQRNIFERRFKNSQGGYISHGTIFFFLC